MPNPSAARPSSYRRAFGSQTAYSTAGNKQWGNLDPAIQGILNKKKDTKDLAPKAEGADDTSNNGSMINGEEGNYRPSSPSQIGIPTDANGLAIGNSSGAGQGAGGSTLPYGLQLSQPMYPAMMIGKTNEADQLSNLNSRFQSYISKVRYLEETNKKLEEKIKERTKRAMESKVKASDIEEIYHMRKQIDDLTVTKANFQVERDNLRGDAMELKQKLEEENSIRNELDDELTRLRKDVDDATMVRTDLERKIETLREELDYNKKVHHEEQKQLKKQIEQQGLQVEVDGPTADITEMLRQIRAQYDQISIKHRDEAEQWYKKKCEDLEVKQKNNGKELEKTSNEINEYRRQVTNLEMELESLRGTNEYLERNLQDVEKRYELDLTNHQNRLNRMQNDLDKATIELKRHISEYKNLMTIKLTLEKELEGYQNLLDEEDNIEIR